MTEVPYDDLRRERDRLEAEVERLKRTLKAATSPRMSDYGPETPHDELLIALNAAKGRDAEVERLKFERDRFKIQAEDYRQLARDWEDQYTRLRTLLRDIYADVTLPPLLEERVEAELFVEKEVGDG